MTLPDHLQALVDELVSRGEIRPICVSDTGDVTITEPVLRRLLQGAWEYGRLSVLSAQPAPAAFPGQAGGEIRPPSAVSFDGDRPVRTPGSGGEDGDA